MVNFLLSNYESIVSITLVLVSLVTSIVSAVKARRSKATSQIISQIAEIVAEVESVLPNGFGDVKLGFVLRQVEKLCLAARIPFDKVAVTEQIEKVLAAPCKSKSKREV